MISFKRYREDLVHRKKIILHIPAGIKKGLC